ncbi:MAG TPA: DUF6463 family protein [Chryseosolibacter sp.]|nr:DUF6463 family protein [Chryseosolibacter sp.]
MTLSKNTGNLLIATGILHNTIGFVMGWSVLVGIAKSGFVNSINNEMDRNAIFWFLFAGFLMMMLGKLMQDYLKIESHLPRTLGIGMLVLSVIGCVMMPVSGFWLVVPQAVLILLPHTKRRELVV